MPSTRPRACPAAPYLGHTGHGRGPGGVQYQVPARNIYEVLDEHACTCEATDRVVGGDIDECVQSQGDGQGRGCAFDATLARNPYPELAPMPVAEVDAAAARAPSCVPRPATPHRRSTAGSRCSRVCAAPR